MEQALTHSADINEILYGYYMLGGSWKGFIGASDAKKQLKDKGKKVSPQEYTDQEERAKVMAKDTIRWMSANGYSPKVKKVWWTARPGILSKAVGQDVDSRKNPTDVLVQTADGSFLGLSAKSTKTKGDIGFKNPGIGTIEKNLKVDLKFIHNDALEKLQKKYKEMPSSSKARKKWLRDNKDIRNKSIEVGKQVLASIRDAVKHSLLKMQQKKLRAYIINDWMDANNMYPPYIKVTGQGKNGKYSSSILDPLKNNKMKALGSGKIEVEPVGSDAVGIRANGKKILKMRAKFESEKMASSIKFSGEPW
jgi:hypothetical protein